MSKRNFILFIIVLTIIVAIIFGIFYFYQPQNKTGVVADSINFIANFLPFGKSTNLTPINNTTPVDISGSGEDNIASNSSLIKISSFSIAGYGVFNKEINKGEFVPTLRYINKATGNIYQTFADTIDERKFSSTVIPIVYDAYFANNTDSVILRYLKTGTKTIETFVGNLPKEVAGVDLVGNNEIKGSFLPENISSISVSPDTNQVFYLFDVGENTAGVIFSPQTSTKIQIFNSAFSEWKSNWQNKNILTLTTKPSVNIPGFMYIVNPEKKDFNKILGGINGLATLLSPDGKNILYSDDNLSLKIFDINTNNSSSIGLKTLAEKCVWGISNPGITTENDVIYCAVPNYLENAQYPDAWYQGEISFSDQIWKIDVKSGSTTLLVDPTSTGNKETLDAIKLNLDTNQNYLFFINKKDNFLWELKLK